MDVHCTACNEPWDTYHLWHDAISETGLSEAEIAEWERLPRGSKLKPKWRDAFQGAGYTFGRTVINVIRCPACPKDAQPEVGKLHLKAELENLLGQDEDGLAATFEDHGL